MDLEEEVKRIVVEILREREKALKEIRKVHRDNVFAYISALGGVAGAISLLVSLLK